MLYVCRICLSFILVLIPFAQQQSVPHFLEKVTFLSGYRARVPSLQKQLLGTIVICCLEFIFGLKSQLIAINMLHIPSLNIMILRDRNRTQFFNLSHKGNTLIQSKLQQSATVFSPSKMYCKHRPNMKCKIKVKTIIRLFNLQSIMHNSNFVCTLMLYCCILQKSFDVVIETVWACARLVWLSLVFWISVFGHGSFALCFFCL